jgi:hypothetical protein
MRIPTPTLGQASRVDKGDIVSATTITDHFSKLLILCAEYERLCDQISLINYSTKDINDTSLKDLSRQISSLEKLIEEFAFLYGGDPGFTYSWSDSFDNDLFRESFSTIFTSGTNGYFVDRDGTLLQEEATINPASGTLILGERLEDGSNPKTTSLLLENASAYRKQTTPLTTDNCIVADYYTDNRVNNPLEGTTMGGIQILVRYKLESKNHFNCITINNHSVHPIHILKVWIRSAESEDAEYTWTPEEPVEIFRDKSIYIPATSGNRIDILFCQQHYRIEQYNPTENKEETPTNLWKDSWEHGTGWIPSSDGRPIAPVYDGNTMLYNKNEPVYIWEDDYTLRISTANEKAEEIYGNYISEYLHEYGPNTPIINRRASGGSGLKYHYNILIKNISLFLDTSFSSKAVYVSKPIATSLGDGQHIEEISLQAFEEHPFNLQEGRETSRSTSAEYYITTDNCNTWIPIRPSNDNVITGERVFFDQNTATARTLFPFVQDSLRIYRNGRMLNRNSDEFTIINGQIVGGENYGVSVALKAQVYGAEHIYTVDYTPALEAPISLTSTGIGTYAVYTGKLDYGAGLLPEFSLQGGIRIAVILRNNGIYPSSPQVFAVQIKGKVGETSG